MEDNQKAISHYLLGAILLCAAACTVLVLFGGKSESDRERIVISLEPYEATFPVSAVSNRSSSPVVDPSRNRNKSASVADSNGLEFFLAAAGTGSDALEGISRTTLRPIDFSFTYIQEAKSFELGSNQLINLILKEEGKRRLQQLSVENNLRDHGSSAKVVVAMLDGQIISSSTFKQPTDDGHLVLSTALSKQEREEVVSRINDLCQSL